MESEEVPINPNTYTEKPNGGHPPMKLNQTAPNKKNLVNEPAEFVNVNSRKSIMSSLVSWLLGKETKNLEEQELDNQNSDKNLVHIRFYSFAYIIIQLFYQTNQFLFPSTPEMA